MSWRVSKSGAETVTDLSAFSVSAITVPIAARLPDRLVRD